MPPPWAHINTCLCLIVQFVAQDSFSFAWRAAHIGHLSGEHFPPHPGHPPFLCALTVLATATAAIRTATAPQAKEGKLFTNHSICFPLHEQARNVVDNARENERSGDIEERDPCGPLQGVRLSVCGGEGHYAGDVERAREKECKRLGF